MVDVAATRTSPYATGSAPATTSPSPRSFACWNLSETTPESLLPAGPAFNVNKLSEMLTTVELTVVVVPWTYKFPAIVASLPI